MRLNEKIFGSLLGGAIGNAMGSVVENWDYERIERTYGKIKMPLMLDRIQTEDDNRISLLYCMAYLKYQRNITPEDLAEIWLKHFDPGTEFFWCMRNALELLRRGISPRQTGIYNINTGSALMAIAPVGMYNIGEPARAYSDALDLAYMYQPEPDSLCAAAFAAGVSKAFTPSNSVEAKIDSIIGTIRKFASEKQIVHWDDRRINSLADSLDIAIKIADKYGNDWLSSRSEIYERLLQWHPIDPIEVLSLTVCLFKMTGGDYVEGCIAGTNIGRDADTIANLIGTLSGAIHGISAIPNDWLEGVKEINMELYSKFKRIGSEMAELVVSRMNKYRRLSDLYLP